MSMTKLKLTVFCTKKDMYCFLVPRLVCTELRVVCWICGFVYFNLNYYCMHSTTYVIYMCHMCSDVTRRGSISIDIGSGTNVIL